MRASSCWSSTSEQNCADVYTEPLSKEVLERHGSDLGLRRPDVDVGTIGARPGLAEYVPHHVMALAVACAEVLGAKGA